MKEFLCVKEYKLLENRLDKLEKVIRLYFITVLGIFYNDRFAKKRKLFLCVWQRRGGGSR